MTQEQKDLLLKDLSSRLPYGVKVKYENEIFDVEYVCPMYEEVKLDIPETWTVGVSKIKPYLFPMSSMTDEQKKEYALVMSGNNLSYSHLLGMSAEDWFNKNHFDYRGLIDKGLAIDATNKNIY
jgi:hypothetical protein